MMLASVSGVIKKLYILGLNIQRARRAINVCPATPITSGNTACLCSCSCYWLGLLATMPLFSALLDVATGSGNLKP